MFKRVLAIPAAILGVLLSHELTYTLLTSSASKKHALEEATGHGWRESYPQILTFLILGLFISTYVGLGNKYKKLSLPKIFLMQEFAFLAVEFGERMSGHHNVMPSLSIILLGTILQIPATFIIGMLLKIVVEPIIRKLVNLNKKKKTSIRLVKKIISTPYQAFHDNSYYLSNLAGRGPPSLLM